MKSVKFIIRYTFTKSNEHMMKCGWKWSLKPYINRHSSELNLTSSKNRSLCQTKNTEFTLSSPNNWNISFQFFKFSFINTFVIFNTHYAILWTKIVFGFVKILTCTGCSIKYSRFLFVWSFLAPQTDKHLVPCSNPTAVF